MQALGFAAYLSVESLVDRVANWIESGITVAEYTRVDVLEHPDAAAALRFWQNRPADGIKIGRDVPSRAIARLLSRTVIYEPMDGGIDFKVHLAGSGIRRRFGRDITGELLSQLYNANDLLPRLKGVQEVLATGEARTARVIHRAADVEVLKIELFQMPLMAPNGTDRWVLTFAFYF